MLTFFRTGPGRFSRRHRRCQLAGAAASVFAATVCGPTRSASAATVNWDNDASTLLWGTPANWSGNALPGPADVVRFGSVNTTPALSGTINLGGTTRTIDQLLFTHPGQDAIADPTYTLTNGTLALNSFSATNGTFVEYLAADIAANLQDRGNGITYDNASFSNLTVTGKVTTNSFTIRGPKDRFNAGNDTFTRLVFANTTNALNGTIRVEGGVLQANGLGTIGTAGAASVVLDGGKLNLRSDGNTAWNNNVTVLSNSGIELSRLNGSANAVHTIGSLTIGNCEFWQTGEGGQRLTVSGQTTLKGNAGFFANGTTLAGPITDEGNGFGLTLIGGELTLAGAATYGGATAVPFFGTLRTAASERIPDTSAVTLSTTSATLNLQTFNETIGSLSGNGRVVLDYDSGTGQSGRLTVGADNTSTTFSGIIDGIQFNTAINDSCELIKIGSGTLSLSGANTFGGPGGRVTVSGGTLAVTADNNLGKAPTPVTLAGGTLRADATFATARQVTLGTGRGTIEVSDRNTLTASGTLVGAGGLTVRGAGALKLTGVNSFTGGVTVDGGTLDASADGNLGAASNAVSLTSGGTLRFGAPFTTGRTVSADAGGGNLEVVSGTSVLAGPAAGSGAMTKTGAGVLRVTAAGSNTGTLAAAGGTLQLAGPAGRMTAAPTVTVSNGATLELNSTTALGGTEAGNNRLGDAAALRLGSGTFRLAGANGTPTAETLGSLSLDPGQGTISLIPGTGGTTTLTFASGLGTRANGAVLDVAAANLGTTNRLFLAGQAAGILGAWATVNGTDFAAYDATRGVIPLGSADASTTLASNVHVRLSSSPSGTVTSSFSPLTLALDASAAPVNIVQSAGATLNVTSGGILKTGVNPASITGGSLTSTGADLAAMASGGDMTVSSAVNGSAGLLKLGAGNLALRGANTYAGATVVNAGTLSVDGGGSVAGTSGITVNSGGAFRMTSGTTVAAPTARVNTGGVFEQAGGSLNVGLFTQAGGTISGTLQNLGTFRYLGGTFAGQLVNQGSADLAAADFTAANGLTHASATPLSIPANRLVTLNGAGLDVEGPVESAGSVVTSQTAIGLTRDASFVQTGGSQAVAGTLTIAGTQGVTGLYEHRAGALSADTVRLGSGGTFARTGGTLSFKRFIQTGGSLSDTSAAGSFNTGVLVSNATPGVASYTLSGGNVFATGVFTIGGTPTAQSADGAFVQSGGTVDVERLSVARFGTGSYSLSDGVLSERSVFELGVVGRGSFIQTGGTHSAGSVTIESRNLDSTYDLRGGLFSTASIVDLGGSIVQSGGVCDASGFVSVASYDDATANGTVNRGTYQLTGGTLLTGRLQVRVADFIQDGGVVRTPELTMIGGGTSGLGRGDGHFIHNSGTTDVGQISFFAFDSGLAQFTLNGGTLNAQQLFMQASGTRRFIQTGGVFRAGTITVFNREGGNGSYLQQGGSLIADSINVGTNYTQTGGTADVRRLANGDPGGFGVSGALTVSGGVMNANAAILGDGSTTVSSGGRLNADVMTVTGGQTVAQGGISAGTFGTGLLVLAGSSSPTVTLNADTVNPGRLVIGAGGVRTTNTSGTVRITSGTVGAGQSPGVIDLGGALRPFDVGDGAADVDLEVTARITNGGVVKQGAGTLALGGPNDWAGGLTVAAGVVRVDTPATFRGDVRATKGPDGTGTIAVSADNRLGAVLNPLNLDGGVLRVTGPAGFATARPLTLGPGGDGQVDVSDPAAVLTLSTPLAGSAGLLKAGAGTLVLPGGNTFGGATSVRGGTLRLPANDALHPARSLVSVAAGARVELAGSRQAFGALAGGGTVDLGGGGSLTIGAAPAGADTASRFAGVITGGGRVVHVAPASSAFAGDHTFTGGLEVAGGTLRVEPGASHFAGGVRVAGATALLDVASDASLGVAANGLTLGGGGTVQFASGFASARTINVLPGAAGGNLAVRTGQTISFGGALGGSGVLGIRPYANGAESLAGGTLAITGAGGAGFTGALEMADGAGTLRLGGAAGSLAGASSVTVRAGAVLEVDEAAANANRLGDLSALHLESGTLRFGGMAGRTEAMGDLFVNSGDTFIDLAGGDGGTISFASLAVARRGNLNLTGAGLGELGDLWRVYLDSAPNSLRNVTIGANKQAAVYNVTYGIVPMGFVEPGTGGSAGGTPVPEPACGVVMLICSAVAARRRRESSEHPRGDLW